MKTRSICWVAAIAAGVLRLASNPVHAQNPGASDASRNVAEQAEAVTFRTPANGVQLRSQTAQNGTGSTSDNSEFGDQRIIQRRAHVEPWSVVADTQYFYTDNAALTPTNKQADSYLRYGVAVSYTNRIKGPLFLDLSLQQYFFQYAKFDSLDFDLTQFNGGLLLEAPWLDDSFFFARYYLQRITEPTFGKPFFISNDADLGWQKVWKISRGQQIFAGATADLSVHTDPGSDARNEYSATLGYSARLTERLTASLSYRGAFNSYLENSRSDWNHIVALGITYDLTDWLRLGVGSSYCHNQSNRAFADYDNFIEGCSISLRAVF